MESRFFYYSLFFYGQCTGQKNNEAQGTTVPTKFSNPDHLSYCTPRTETLDKLEILTWQKDKNQYCEY